MANPAVLLTSIGHLEPFDPNGLIPFSQWVELFEEFCSVNLIPVEPRAVNGAYLRLNNRRRSLFLTLVGQRCYAILHSSFLPERPNQRPIPDLVRALMNRFEPPGLIPANRLRFSTRVRKANESVHEYIAAIQVLAAPCQFGLFLNDALRDRLVSGINMQKTQEKLLSTPELTYDMAKHIVLQDDAVRQQARAMAEASTVNAVKTANFCRQNVHGAQKKSQPQANQYQQRSGGQASGQQRSRQPR